MKKMRKLLQIAAAALVLTACGAKKAPPVPAVTQAPTEPTVAEAVVEKTRITAIVAEHSGKTADWWAGFEQTYEGANPQIDLQITCVSWHDIEAVVRNRIAQGDLPDLLNIDSFHPYQADGLLLPAEQWVSPETYAKFYPGLHTRASADGVVWGIPDHVTARALYYNADILAGAEAEVPSTWKELVTTCQKIKAYDHGLYPWGMDITSDEGYASFAYYIWNNGSDFVDAEGNWTLDAAKNLEAVEFIVKMVDSRLTNPDPTAENRYELQDLFGQGKVAMMIAPSSLPAYCLSGGSMVNYGIAPLPANGSNPSVSTASGNFLLCFADEDRTPEKLAAITAVVDAIYEDTTYTQWVQTEGFLPATTTGNALLQAQDPHMAVWNQILSSVKFYPSHWDMWNNVKEGAVEALQNTLWNGNAWLQLDRFQRKIVGG